MKAQAQRRAIARFMLGSNICSCGLHWLQSDKKGCGNPVANYPGDLNAMAWVEQTLTPDQREDYAHALSQMVPQSVNHGPLAVDEPEAGDIMCWSLFDLATATATQRAEAFLRTVGLWTEDAP